MTILRRDSVPERPIVSGYPAPYNLGDGNLRVRGLSDAGGLTQFGACVETLLPGGQSSQPHWHEKEDEFLYVLSGEITVVEDGAETAIGPGDACAWPAGSPVAHTILNRTDRPAVYLIVGTRAEGEVCHYPGLDLRDEAGRYVHLDGTPYPPDDTTENSDIPDPEGSRGETT